MIPAASHPASEHWRSSTLWAVLGHLLLALGLIYGPALGLFPERSEEVEVRLVRLQGGGENVPGWIKPTPAPADDAVEPDNKPQQQRSAPAEPEPSPKPKPKPAEPETSPPTPETRAKPEQQTPPPVERREEPESAPAETQKAEPGDSQSQPTQEPQEVSTSGSDAPTTGETGEGVGAKPGPEGPGVGARSDADFPGADSYLSRIEVEVQRRFNYRGRGSGAVAEYHFYIEKSGELKQLVLMKASGIGSLDLAGRSALMRAKFPPLPPGFPSNRLGVTYRFHDEKR